MQQHNTICVKAIINKKMITFSGEHIDTAAGKQEHSTPKKGKHNSDCDRMILGYSIIIILCTMKFNTFQTIINFSCSPRHYRRAWKHILGHAQLTET